MIRYGLCPQAEAWPGCGQIEGVEPASTSPRVQAWSCTACETRWAITVVSPSPQPYFDRLAATVEEVGRLRWLLGQVVILGADADALTDEQLRTRVLALAESCATQ